MRLHVKVHIIVIKFNILRYVHMQFLTKRLLNISMVNWTIYTFLEMIHSPGGKFIQITIVAHFRLWCLLIQTHWVTHKKSTCLKEEPVIQQSEIYWIWNCNLTSVILWLWRPNDRTPSVTKQAHHPPDPSVTRARKQQVTRSHTIFLFSLQNARNPSPFCFAYESSITFWVCAIYRGWEVYAGVTLVPGGKNEYGWKMSCASWYCIFQGFKL